MKKNFIYFAITLLMGLFAACSQEEAPEASSNANNLVNISAEYPLNLHKHVLSPK